MKYYKALWNEVRGDEYAVWGTSIWYFELDKEYYPIRQVEQYANGVQLQYDAVHLEDQYGMLGDQPIAIEEMKGIVIAKEEFEIVWNRVINNIKEIP